MKRCFRTHSVESVNLLIHLHVSTSLTHHPNRRPFNSLTACSTKKQWILSHIQITEERCAGSVCTRREFRCCSNETLIMQGQHNNFWFLVPENNEADERNAVADGTEHKTSAMRPNRPGQMLIMV
jgi:hypothetical protein